MSPPPPASPKPPALPAASRARWLDRIVAALLAGSLGVTVATTVSALLAAAGVELPDAPWAPPRALVDGHPRPGHDPHAPGVPLPHRPPEILAHPDDPEILFDPDRDPDADEAPRGQVGLARAPLTLREQPVSTADVVGEVKAGEQVTIPIIVGDWALVSYGGGAVMGWAKKSEIAIR